MELIINIWDLTRFGIVMLGIMFSTSHQLIRASVLFGWNSYPCSYYILCVCTVPVFGDVCFPNVLIQVCFIKKTYFFGVLGT